MSSIDGEGARALYRGARLISEEGERGRERERETSERV
jgi:hypothetical protein